jgi:hypothetical protein
VFYLTCFANLQYSPLERSSCGKMLYKSLLLASATAVVTLVSACDNTQWSVELTDATTTITNSFDAAFDGSSSDNTISINIQNNAGSVTRSGRTTNVVVNKQIPWGSDLTLYAIIGSDDTSILMGWVYCTGNQLTDLWLEDTTGSAGFTVPVVTGTCSINNNEKDVDISTAQECIQITPPPVYPSIDGGDSLSLQPDQVGNVKLDDEDYNLLPFAIVNCADCSASSTDGGWVEVHSVMSSKSSDNVCLGIIYLPTTHTPSIAMQYINCFSKDVADPTFNATYDLNGTDKNSPASTSTTIPSATGTTATATITTVTATATATATATFTTSTTSSSSGIVSGSANTGVVNLGATASSSTTQSIASQSSNIAEPTAISKVAWIGVAGVVLAAAL